MRAHPLQAGFAAVGSGMCVLTLQVLQDAGPDGMEVTAVSLTEGFYPVHATCEDGGVLLTTDGDAVPARLWRYENLGLIPCPMHSRNGHEQWNAVTVLVHGFDILADSASINAALTELLDADMALGDDRWQCQHMLDATEDDGVPA